MDVNYLSKWENSLEEISEKISRLNFQRYVTKGQFPNLKGLENQRAEILGDPKIESMISEFEETDDAILNQKMEHLKNRKVMNTVSLDPEIRELNRSLAEKVVYYKYDVNGDLLELGKVKSILRKSSDRDLRKQAYLSYSKQSEDLKDDLLKLIKLRNSKAQSVGFESYVDMVLGSMGISEELSVNLLTELIEKTQDKYEEVINSSKKRFGLETIQPWDVQFLLENYGDMNSSLFPKEGIQPAVSKWISSFGHTLESLGIEIVRADIPYNGLCMGIKQGEVKLLSNPDDGFAYYSTMFHELGHGLHNSLKDVPSMLLRNEPSLFNESMAEVFGFVPNSVQWLESHGLSTDQANLLLKSVLGPKFFYLRQRAAYALFEYQLYKDPDGNIDKIFAETEARVLGCEPDYTHRWAANPWFISFPVYWQNYVIADVIAAQIHNHMEENFGPLVDSKEAFDFIVERYIKPGGTIPWREKVEGTTGEKLTAKYIVDMINKK